MSLIWLSHYCCPYTAKKSESKDLETVISSGANWDVSSLFFKALIVLLDTLARCLHTRENRKISILFYSNSMVLTL